MKLLRQAIPIWIILTITAFAFASFLSGFWPARAANQLTLVPGPPAYSISQYSYTNITTDTTTTIKSGTGVLHEICINTPAATETITLWDNTSASGTKIGTITVFASTNPCMTYDIVFQTGLTIVTATAASDLTVAWL